MLLMLPAKKTQGRQTLKMSSIEALNWCSFQCVLSLLMTWNLHIERLVSLRTSLWNLQVFIVFISIRQISSGFVADWKTSSHLLKVLDLHTYTWLWLCFSWWSIYASWNCALSRCDGELIGVEYVYLPLFKKTDHAFNVFMMSHTPQPLTEMSASK